MEIIIPHWASSEIRYAVNCLFIDFLGLEINILESKEEQDVIVCLTSSTLRLRIIGFSSKVKDTDVKYIYPSYVTKGMLGVGNNKYELTSLFGLLNIRQDGKFYTLECDIFASTFFMLSRWEEKINPVRDQHGRFPASESLAYKHGFLDRPIVNEYVELLWAILQEMGCTQERKKWTYKMVPTHDVDKPYLFNGLMQGMRTVAGNIKRGRLGELARYFGHTFSRTDPFDSYDRLMDLSETADTKSHFFFLQKGNAKQDEKHDINTPRVIKLMKHIRERGHEVGFHPSYDAYKDGELFKREKEYLEEIVGIDIKTGRHHFLRWDVNETPRIWQDNDMKWDSTLGYADHAGFRCGVCYPFPLFDLENNCQLDLYERPLIAMEWSLIHYQGLDITAASSYIDKLKIEVKKYGGEFVFLYHNSAFFTDEYLPVSKTLLDSFYNPIS